MQKNKERLDILLVQKKMFNSREKARASIMAGEIYVDDKKIDKCGEMINSEANIEFRGSTLPYVSRGGLKLEKAIKSFNIKLENKVCMDIGASTGGFTDCMLQNGAKKVYSIDVGYGQFAWKLRNDPRVVLFERTNARYLKKEDINDDINFASIDVSFISLTKIIPALLELLEGNGEVVSLIKPQFEAGREKVGKKGVVKDKNTHIEVIEKIIIFLKENNCRIINLDYSPIKGPEGNMEYLVYFSKNSEVGNKDVDIELIVNNAHNTLQ